jgi:hypothetical protein
VIVAKRLGFVYFLVLEVIIEIRLEISVRPPALGGK